MGNKKQICVALSSREAEYIGLSEAIKETIHFTTATERTQYSVTVFNDNQGAAKVRRELEFEQKVQHIDIRFHFIRDVIKSEQVEVLRIRKMLVDIFMKPLTFEKNEFYKQLGRK